ncbi:MAG: sulfatase-like hydrolase/transferase, partial [Planctomycetota bacterium]
LQETGQFENTIIVFTSDQGYVWGQHGLKGKIDPYETAIRSPFIVTCPQRFPSGEVCKAPINGADVIRTFHTWAKTDPRLFLPGRDITPLVMQPTSESVLKRWSEVPTLMTYVHNRYEPMEMAKRLKNEDWDACMYSKGAPWYFMTLVENFKYTRYAHPNRIEELYDLEEDPEELNNLAANEEFKDKLLEMRASCIQSIKSHGGAVFADHLPPPKTLAVPLAVRPPGDITVYHEPGKKRFHREGCRRLTSDRKLRAAMTKMTLAEAEAQGLPLCSRCPGSSTAGRESR